MTQPALRPASCKVASLHLHPATPGEPMLNVSSIEVIQDQGIVANKRYFGRRSTDTGAPSQRQVSLIEREQLAEHAAALGLEVIPPGAVRANIETVGLELVSLAGCEIEIGQTILLITTPRDPCSKMDQVCLGLRSLMEKHRQGVLARVIRSGRIEIGDKIRLPREELNAAPA